MTPTASTTAPADRLASLEAELAATREEIAEVERSIAAAAAKRDDVNERWRLDRARRPQVTAGTDREAYFARIEEVHAADPTFQAELDLYLDEIAAGNRRRASLRGKVNELLAEIRPLHRRHREIDDAPDLDKATADQAYARQKLEELTAEQSALPVAMEQAKRTVDTDEITRLQVRARDLPLHIHNARTAVLVADRAHAQAMLARSITEQPDPGDVLAAEAAVVKAQQKLEKVRAEHEAAYDRCSHWRSAVTRLGYDLQHHIDRDPAGGAP